MKNLFMVALLGLMPLLGLANITSQTDKTGPVTFTGSPQVIPVGFPFQQASDLLVLDSGQSGVTHDPALVLTLNSDYTVTGGGYNTATQMQVGSVRVVNTGSHTVQNGDQIVIMRNVPINQTTSFSATGPLTIALIEQALDKTATLSQQVNELAQRSLHFENFETNSGLMPLSARKNSYPFFDANGALTWSAGTGQGGQGVYTAGAGLLLASNVFSVNPVQSLTSLTVTNPITASITGNATTATALATPRAINGVNFDGTAPITVTAAAGTLTGAVLNSTVTSAPGVLSTAVGTLNTMAIQAANNVAITGGAITGMGSPSAASDVATKAYVDNAVSAGLVIRTSVAVATTANLTLSGEQTIDGVLTSTSRILVKNQSAPAQNGIYVTAAGAWSRASDSNTAGKLLIGYYYFVSSGTTQGATGWTIQAPQVVTLGTDPVAFGQFSASTTYTAGVGLTLGGNVFAIAAAQTGLTINNSTIGQTTPAAGTFTQATVNNNSFLGNLVIKSGQLNEFATNGVGAIDLNFDGYNGGTTQFRNVRVYDGKNAQVAIFTGSTKSLDVVGAISAASFSGAGTGLTGTAASLTSGSATILSTTRTIGGSNFNGSANVTSFPAPGAIGGTTPSTAVFTTITPSSGANGATTKANYNITVINVKDYGAAGNGSADDTTKINSAISAMTSYSTLYFPAGRYRFTGGLTGFSSLTHIKVTGESAELYNDSGSAGGNTFVFDTGCSNVEVCGLIFTGASTVRGNGIHIRMAASNCSIHDCFFQGCSDFGVLISYGNGDWLTNAVVSNNIFFETLGDGLHIGSAINVSISGNVFLGTGDDGIGIVADYAAYQPNRVTVTGNTISYAGSTAYVPTAVSGCGIRIDEATDITVTGNEIYSPHQSGILCARNGSTTAYNARIHITGNKIYNAQSGASGSGSVGSIWIKWTNLCDVSDNQVIDPAAQSGIAFKDVNDLTIRGNFIRKCPSRSITADANNEANVATSWTNIYINNNDIDWTQANEAIYVVPYGSAITLTNVMICGNTAQIVGGYWIYYDYVSTGRIYNNTNQSGATVSGGAHNASVTTGNNNG